MPGRFRQRDHQQQLTTSPLERHRLQQPPRQRVRHRDDPHLTRQHGSTAARQLGTKMLQAVGFSLGTEKTHLPHNPTEIQSGNGSR